MDTKNLECSDLELKFIQHCIVYYGACAIGDTQAAMFGFRKANELEVKLGAPTLVDLQKKIFKALGFDESVVDKESDGQVIYYDDDKKGNLKKVEQTPLNKNVM